MTLIDWIVVALIVVFAIFGMLFGFGKGLKFFTCGIFGIIISIFICYALGGVIYSIGFVKKGLSAFSGALENKNAFCNFLLKIHIEVIVFYVALFILVSIARIVIVRVIKKVAEVENLFLIIINKTFGVILFVGAFFMIMLFVFWIMALIGVGGSGKTPGFLLNSGLKLNWLYEHNPFMTILRFVFKIRITVPA